MLYMLCVSGVRRCLPVLRSLELKISKLPNLKKVGAMRRTVDALSSTAFPLYSGSLTIMVSDVTRLPALVVGMPCTTNTSLLPLHACVQWVLAQHRL